MANFSNDAIQQAMKTSGMIPVFYNADIEVAKAVEDASSKGGVRVFEFTNRGENAFSVRQYVQALKGAGFKVTKILSPFETPINYFPMTYENVQEAVATILHWPIPQWIPSILIRTVSRVMQTPGRLYTFVCDRERA